MDPNQGTSRDVRNTEPKSCARAKVQFYFRCFPMGALMKRSSVLSCLAGLIILILLNSLWIPWGSAAPAQGPPATAGSEPSTTTVIVKAAKGLQLAQQLSAITGHGGVVKRSIPKLNLHVVEVPAAAAAAITKALSSGSGDCPRGGEPQTK